MSEQIVSTGNERDAIRITIDRDLPDMWVPESIDQETGETVPGHYVDMSGAFKLIAETRHEACGRVHGYTVIGIKSLVDDWPEMMEDYYLEEILKSVLRAVEECEQ